VFRILIYQQSVIESRTDHGWRTMMSENLNEIMVDQVEDAALHHLPLPCE